MNTLNLALMSLQKKAVTMVLIILELAALFLAENYLTCSVGERTMLIKPYNAVLNDDSFLVFDVKFTEKVMNDSQLNLKKSQEEILGKLEGNFTVYNFLIYRDPTYSEFIIYSVADEIYNALALPLSSGSYGGKTNSAVASKGISKGELQITTPDMTLTLDISGSLTENTFMPECTSFGTDLTVRDLYTSFIGSNAIITKRSAVGDNEKFFNCSPAFIIKFNSAEDAEKNMAMLQSECGVIAGSTIMDNTIWELYDDLKGFVPVLCCILLIVFIGLICMSSIIFNENKYRNGVLWICGYSRKRIIAIQAESILIMLVISLAVFASLSFLLNLFISNNIIDSSSFGKINFGLSNFVVTALTCIVLVAVSAAVPFVKSIKISPVEYLGRSK